MVVDIDNEKSSKIEDQDFIGDVVCTLAEIVTAKGGKLTKPLLDSSHPNTKRGYLSIRAEEVQGINDQVCLNLSAKSLTSKEWFGLAKSNRTHNFFY